MRTLQFFIDKLDKSYYLSYVDYRDSLDEHLNLIQEAIRDGDMDRIYDEATTWYDEQEWESANEYASQCLSQNDATDEEVEEHTDNLRDEVFNRNEGNPVKDLLKHTSDQFMYYELGLELEEYSAYSDDKSFLRACKLIAKKAKINYEKNEIAIRSLLANASYGGTLCYFFSDSPARFIDNKIKTIGFYDNCCLAIIDRCNGSGHDEEVKADCEFKFDSKAIWLDECAGGYSYGGGVCGLHRPSYDKYSPTLIAGKKSRPTPESRFREQGEWISTGNVITNIQYSAFIRAHDEILCNGTSREKGHLRAWDIEHFPCKIPSYVLEAIRLHPDQLNLVNFHVNLGKKEKKHIGWILVDKNKKIVYEKAEDYNDFGWAKEKLLASIAKYK